MSSSSSSVIGSVSSCRPIRKSMNNELIEPTANKTNVRCM